MSNQERKQILRGTFDRENESEISLHLYSVFENRLACGRSGLKKFNSGVGLSLRVDFSRFVGSHSTNGGIERISSSELKKQSRFRRLYGPCDGRSVRMVPCFDKARQQIEKVAS